MKVDMNLSDILTLPMTIMAAISMCTGVVLFAPIGFIEKMYLIDLRENYGFVIGVVFLLFTSILFVNGLYRLIKELGKIKRNRWFISTAGERLKKLSIYQKTIVYHLYTQDNKTELLPIHDGAV